LRKKGLSTPYIKGIVSLVGNSILAVGIAVWHKWMDRHSPFIKICSHLAITNIVNITKPTTITKATTINSIMAIVMIISRNIKIERIKIYHHRMWAKATKAVETNLVIRKIAQRLKVRLVAILVVFSTNE
jgi:hypothetical protein